MIMFCNKENCIRNFLYCEGCAIDNSDIHNIFFCSSCQKQKKSFHKTHKNQVTYIDDSKFTQAMAQLKGIVYQQIQSIRLKATQQKIEQSYFNEIMNNIKQKLQLLKLIDEKEKLIKLLLNQTIMKWLIEMKFWQGRQRNSFMQFQNRVKSNLEQKMIQADPRIQPIINPGSSRPKQQKFSIIWAQNNIDKLVESQVQQLAKQINLRKKQSDICNLVIKLFASFNRNQCLETFDQAVQLQRKYPDSKVLYLVEIRTNELLAGGNQQIPKILNKIKQRIDSNFDATDIYHYYMAMAQWEMTDQRQKNVISFFQLKNKAFYKLVNPNLYIESLIKAISIRQKPVYYISLGLGYIVKENYQQAVRVFKKAVSMLTKRNDCLDLNKFWAQINLNSDHLQFQSIMENLQTRTLQFITNVCKYFKNSQHYQELVVCCEQLITRQPSNQNFKIQFVKSILSYSSKLSQFGEDDDQRLKRADIMIIDLKTAEQFEASKLQKRLTRVRAQNQFKNNNFVLASDSFGHLAKGTKLTSASDYYNYAATLFKVFMNEEYKDQDQQQLKLSYQNINKALRLKSDSIKYKKLKFFICAYMNLFNEANSIYEELKKINPSLINQAEYERLIEFVQSNMEV